MVGKLPPSSKAIQQLQIKSALSARALDSADWLSPSCAAAQVTLRDLELIKRPGKDWIKTPSHDFKSSSITMHNGGPYVVTQTQQRGL